VAIGVVVTLPGDVVDIFLRLRHVGSENFPIEATVLETNLAVEGFDKVFTDAGRASKQSHLSIRFLEDLFHDRTVSMKEVHIFLRKAAMMQHANPLLKHETCASVTLDDRLVSHVEGTHKLEDRDLDREIEWCDNSNRSIRPSVASVELASVVTGFSFAVGKEAYLIAAEVFEEIDSNLNFSGSLLIALGCASLNTLHKEIEHLGVTHALDNTTVDFRKHQVALLVFEGVVETVLGASLQTFNEGIDFIDLSIGDLDHGFASHRIHEVHIYVGRNPFAVDQVKALIFSRKVSRIDSCEGFEVV